MEWLADAQGRVIALFALLKFDAETLWLLLPDAAAADLAAKLQRYVFRSKGGAGGARELHASGAFAAPAQASGARFAATEYGIELDFGGDGGARRMRLGPATAPDAAAAVAQWRRSDLRNTACPACAMHRSRPGPRQQLSLGACAPSA